MRRARARGRARPFHALLAILPPALIFASACADSGEAPVLSIEATGTVLGHAYLDRDGNGALGLADGDVANLGIGLVLGFGRDTAAAEITGSDGSFLLSRIPVGGYRIVVDSATIPDSLRLIGIDSARLTLGAADTIPVLVELSYPTVSVDRARDLRLATTIFLEGIALHNAGVLGDGIMHVADSTGAIRLTRVRFAGVFAGDSIRVRGTRSLSANQPSIQNAQIFIIGPSLGQLEPEDTLTTAAAAAADGGRLDAALIRIVDAIVQETATRSGELRLKVDDGSGTLTVAFDLEMGIDPSGLMDATVDANGILVPAENLADVWRLMPRSNDDLNIDRVEPDTTIIGPLFL